MKKRVVGMLLCTVMVISMLSGCGDNKEEAAEGTEEQVTEDTAQEEESSIRDLPAIQNVDVEKFVTLGSYKGITIEKYVTEVTDEDVEMQIADELANNPGEVSDADAKVEEGDTVIIDYVGTLNGEAFEGGTAEGAYLTIGSGQFIDGFESGLVGTTKGQTVDLNLTFPEEYGVDELNGQAVVFTVTVNSILRPVTEISDEWVTTNSDFTTVEEYRENLKKEMQEEQDQIAEENLMTEAWMTVVEDAEISEYPEELINYYKENLQLQVESYVQYTGQTVEEYVESSGMTMEDFELDKEEYAKANVKQTMVMQAIANNEAYTEQHEEYQAMLQEFLTQYGMDEQGLYDTYGQNAVYHTVMMQCVCKLIMNEAEVTEVK